MRQLRKAAAAGMSIGDELHNSAARNGLLAVQIHDELLLEVDKDVLPHASRLVKGMHGRRCCA